MPKGTLCSFRHILSYILPWKGKGKIGGEKAHIGGEFTANWDVGLLAEEEDITEEPQNQQTFENPTILREQHSPNTGTCEAGGIVHSFRSFKTHRIYILLILSPAAGRKPVCLAH